MKSRHLPWFSLPAVACLFAICVTTSCKKSSSGPSSNITATINGTTFQPTLTEGIDLKLLGQLTVTGNIIKGGDTASLSLTFSDTVVNNEVLSIANGNFFEINYWPQISGGIIYSSVSGYTNTASITITSIDTTHHNVSGTFTGNLAQESITLQDSAVITNGKFNSNYTVH